MNEIKSREIARSRNTSTSTYVATLVSEQPIPGVLQPIQTTYTVQLNWLPSCQNVVSEQVCCTVCWSILSGICWIEYSFSNVL